MRQLPQSDYDRRRQTPAVLRAQEGVRQQTQLVPGFFVPRSLNCSRKQNSGSRNGTDSRGEPHTAQIATRTSRKYSEYRALSRPKCCGVRFPQRISLAGEILFSQYRLHWTTLSSHEGNSRNAAGRWCFVSNDALDCGVACARDGVG